LYRVLADLATIPVIDISTFLDSSSSPSERLSTAKALDHACRTVGFFYLSNHGIPLANLTQILSLARKFFALPQAQKDRIRLKPAGVDDGDGARGYQTMGDNVTQGKRDWHEGLDLYKPVETKGPPYAACFGTNKWPSEEFQGVYEGYIQRLLALGRVVMRAFAVGLGLERENFFEGFVDESFWVLRAIGYPPLENDNDGISCGEHTGTIPLLNLLLIRLWMSDVVDC
jgi:isopenicillin N synthase-like dioxygenase